MIFPLQESCGVFRAFLEFKKLRNLKVISRFLGHPRLFWTKNDRGQFWDLVPYFHNVTQSLQRVALKLFLLDYM